MTESRGSTIRKGLALIGCFALLLGGCQDQPEYPVPQRTNDKIDFGAETSNLTIPVFLSLDLVQNDLNRKIPKSLWSINEYRPNCVPAQRVKIFKERVKVTPDLGCRIVGNVTRGKIRLRGRGSNLYLTMPVSATVRARDVGGFLKGETATGSADVSARIRFNVDKNWNLTGKVSIDYDWVEPPGINFLGQRIRFVRRADKELAKVINDLERDLQSEIAKARLRALVAEGWAAGFTVIELNRERPPAWMRITPQGLALAGYSTNGRQLMLNVTASAKTESFIGDRPEPAKPTPLPPPTNIRIKPGLHFYIPVVSTYAELEPVVLRALRKLATRGINVEGVGQIDANFQKVTMYATEGNRLAVGIDVEAEIIGQRLGKRFGKTRGQIWLTGLPVHDTSSQIVHIRDLQVYAKTDRKTADLLFNLVNSIQFRDELARSLTQDFTKDYDKVVAAARKAIGDRQLGAIRMQASIDKVEHGLVKATGEGLYMPVEVEGAAKIVLRK